MADNESKDVEDMMAILAQMEEKAKNMERLVVLRRQVECAKTRKNPEPDPKSSKFLCDMRQFGIFLIFYFIFQGEGTNGKGERGDTETTRLFEAGEG